MSQALADVVLHIVFSTKERFPGYFMKAFPHFLPEEKAYNLTNLHSRSVGNTCTIFIRKVVSLSLHFIKNSLTDVPGGKLIWQFSSQVERDGGRLRLDEF